MAANRTKPTKRANGANGASQNLPPDASLRASGATGATGTTGTPSVSGVSGDGPARRRITITLTEDDYGRFTACHAQQMSRLSAGAGNDTFPELPDSTMALHIFRLGLRQREALNAAEERRVREERRVVDEERKVAEG